MAEITFRITGDKNLEKMFRKLPDKVQRKILRKSVRASAAGLKKVEQQNLFAMTAEDTGKLAGSLKLRAKSMFAKGIVRVEVYASQPDGAHGAALEYGHDVHNRHGGPFGKARPVPWKRAAIEDAKVNVVPLFNRKAAAEIPIEAAKMARVK